MDTALYTVQGSKMTLLSSLSPCLAIAITMWNFLESGSEQSFPLEYSRRPGFNCPLQRIYAPPRPRQMGLSVRTRRYNFDPESPEVSYFSRESSHWRKKERTLFSLGKRKHKWIFSCYEIFVLLSIYGPSRFDLTVKSSLLLDGFNDLGIFADDSCYLI